MDSHPPSKKFPVVALDAMQTVQLGVTAAATDLHHLETHHAEMLDGAQRRLLHKWYRQLDEISREIGGILAD